MLTMMTTATTTTSSSSSTITTAFLSPTILACSAFAVVVLLQVLFTKQTTIRWTDETRRRLQHVTTGQALVCISYLLPLSYCRALLAMGCLAIVYVKFLHERWYRHVFGPLLRPYELQYGVLPGAFYFLLSTCIVASVFNIHVARYSVLCLTYADPMASWIGSYISRSSTVGAANVFKFKIHESASVGGCLACFLTALAVGMLFLLDNADPSSSNNYRIPVIGAVVCMIAEALPYANDNFVIPIATATAVQWAQSFD